jgi:hypothetical protein
MPIKVDIEELKETFGEDLPLEWKVLRDLRNLIDLTKEEVESLHPNCKNYLEQIFKKIKYRKTRNSTLYKPKSKK